MILTIRQLVLIFDRGTLWFRAVVFFRVGCSFFTKQCFMINDVIDVVRAGTPLWRPASNRGDDAFVLPSFRSGPHPNPTIRFAFCS